MVSDNRVQMKTPAMVAGVLFDLYNQCIESGR